MEEYNAATPSEYVFSSIVVEGKKEYRDILGNLSYAGLKKVYLIFLILDAIFYLPLTITDLLTVPTMIASAFFPLWAVYAFLSVEWRIARGYRSFVYQEGKEAISGRTSLGEKLVTESEGRDPKAFDYSDVTAIKETNFLYLVHLKLGLHLIISKDPGCNSGMTDYIEYLFRMCPNIKKRWIIKIMNQQRICIVYVCIFFVFYLLQLIVHLT